MQDGEGEEEEEGECIAAYVCRITSALAGDFRNLPMHASGNLSDDNACLYTRQRTRTTTVDGFE